MALSFKAFQQFVPQTLKTIKPVTLLNLTPGTLTTTTNVSADVSGASFTFAKQETDTQLMVTYGASPYSATAISQVQFNVLVNAVSTSFRLKAFDDIAVREFMGGVLSVASGLTSGSYTIKLQWRRVTGTGTPTLDSSSRIFLACEEIRI